MRITCLAALSAGCLTLGTAALAQQPQPGSSAASPPAGYTPAPVPSAVPSTPGQTSPAAIPDQIAPPANSGGPANSTPFSATPTDQLPSGNGNGGPSVPNLSR